MAYADVGPFEAVVEPHAYLHCHECGQRLWVGVSSVNGAPLFACPCCAVVVSTRRVR